MRIIYIYIYICKHIYIYTYSVHIYICSKCIYTYIHYTYYIYIYYIYLSLSICLSVCLSIHTSMDLSLPSLVCLPRIHTTQETANQRSCDTSWWRVPGSTPQDPTGYHRLRPDFLRRREKESPSQTNRFSSEVTYYYTNNIFIIFHKHIL